jgi:hypothetical protein
MINPTAAAASLGNTFARTVERRPRLTNEVKASEEWGAVGFALA